jgi:lysozyme
MGAAIPKDRPKMTREDVLKEMSAYPQLNGYPVKVLGIRGYYKKTMGNPLKNDRGIYDDAMFIVSPTMFAAFNANTDPSIDRTGIAVLTAPQIVLYQVGIHGISGNNPRQAFRQASFGISVTRDNRPGVFKDSKESPFWINIHDGGNNTTSSEGCQTIPKTQWQSFNEMLKDQLSKNGQRLFPYLLIEYK